MINVIYPKKRHIKYFPELHFKPIIFHFIQQRHPSIHPLQQKKWKGKSACHIKARGKKTKEEKRKKTWNGPYSLIYPTQIHTHTTTTTKKRPEHKKHRTVHAIQFCLKKKNGKLFAKQIERCYLCYLVGSHLNRQSYEFAVTYIYMYVSLLLLLVVIPLLFRHGKPCGPCRVNHPMITQANCSDSKHFRC